MTHDRANALKPFAFDGQKSQKPLYCSDFWLFHVLMAAHFHNQGFLLQFGMAVV
ncbi:MAG: hypothetical protein MR762_05555 [Clostridiales bacterium]|nr:hypothetical protein [Clostridiales bacterium]